MLAAGASAPWRLRLGSFFLFDRLLGLYSSLRLEGMTRISLYHTGVFLQGLCWVGWFYWQASMPHYPSLSSLHRAAVRPLESTALSAQGWDCSFTTGSARQRAGQQGWAGSEGPSQRARRNTAWKGRAWRLRAMAAYGYRRTRH